MGVDCIAPKVCSDGCISLDRDTGAVLMAGASYSDAHMQHTILNIEGSSGYLVGRSYMKSHHYGAWRLYGGYQYLETGT